MIGAALRERNDMIYLKGSVECTITPTSTSPSSRLGDDLLQKRRDLSLHTLSTSSACCDSSGARQSDRSIQRSQRRPTDLITAPAKEKDGHANCYNDQRQ